MFEKAKPVPHTQNDRFVADHAFDDDLLIGTADVTPASGENGSDVLRVIEWAELTARLNAARDLRNVLRRDSNGQEAGNQSSFAEAAARYFRTKETQDHPQEITPQSTQKSEGKRDVNPVALGQSKGSSGISPKHTEPHIDEVRGLGRAAQGDARED